MCIFIYEMHISKFIFLSLFDATNNASVYSLAHTVLGNTCRNTFNRNRVPWATISLAGDLGKYCNVVPIFSVGI